MAKTGKNKYYNNCWIAPSFWEESLFNVKSKGVKTNKDVETNMNTDKNTNKNMDKDIDMDLTGYVLVRGAVEAQSENSVVVEFLGSSLDNNLSGSSGNDLGDGECGNGCIGYICVNL